MKRVLALLGDYYHCSDQQAVLARALELGGETTVVRYPDLPDAASLASYDLIIFAMMGKYAPRDSDEQWFATESQALLARHVRAGAGLLVFHAGTASHPTDGPLRELVGGHFLHHPPEHPPVTVTPVDQHPITAGVSPFTHPDEHYFVDVDDDVTPLLRATSELGETVAGWAADRGDGRVAVIVPGHTREMIGEPMLVKLVEQAAQWCTKSGA